MPAKNIGQQLAFVIFAPEEASSLVMVADVTLLMRFPKASLSPMTYLTWLMSKSLSALVDKSISKPFFRMLKCQPKIKAFLEREFIKLEPSAPYTGTQLKSAECSGGGERENPYNDNRSKFFQKICGRQSTFITEHQDVPTISPIVHREMVQLINRRMEVMLQCWLPYIPSDPDMPSDLDTCDISSDTDTDTSDTCDMSLDTDTC